MQDLGGHEQLLFIGSWTVSQHFQQKMTMAAYTESRVLQEDTVLRASGIHTIHPAQGCGGAWILSQAAWCTH